MTVHEQFADDLTMYALGALEGDEKVIPREAFGGVCLLSPRTGTVARRRGLARVEYSGTKAAGASESPR